MKIIVVGATRDPGQALPGRRRDRRRRSSRGHYAAARSGLARPIRCRSRGLFMACHKSVRRCTLSQKSGLLPKTRAKDERGRRRDLPAVLAQLIDVPALNAHRLGKRDLGQCHRLHEFLNENFSDRGRLTFGHQHGWPHVGRNSEAYSAVQASRWRVTRSANLTASRVLPAV